MIKLSVAADVKAVSRSLDRLAREQLPFAAAQAVNRVAEVLQATEKANMPHVFDRPTPFTVNAVGLKRARKGNPTAIVFVRPIAARYLEPYETGGTNVLNSKALLKPVNIAKNQYGNLSRNALQRLRNTPNVFIGPVTFKGSGETVNGVWLRPPRGKRDSRSGTARRVGTKGNTQNLVAGKRTGLKLLIKFEDAHPVAPRFGFNDTARRIVPGLFERELRAEIMKAIATARIK